jgi:LysM repeat protein
MQVHTHKYGPGEIVDRERVHGRTRVLVAGKGYRVWFDEKDVWKVAGESPLPDDSTEHVDESNSVTLPYDPEPQFSADLFGVDSTIQPGEYELDADDRLHPSDSLTFEDRSEERGPQPNPDLFAKGAAIGDPTPHQTGPHGLDHDAPELREYAHPDFRDDDSGEEGGLDHLLGDPNVEDLEHKGIDESPLGIFLGSKYASWLLRRDDGDHLNDPVQRFRDDPYREIHRQGCVHSADHDPQAEQYGHLIEADTDLREAAWADVRAKAKRLRTEGSVDVHDIAPDRIYATVKGDHGDYDVMVKKGGEFGGYGNGQSVADFSCSCSWGRWAFKRQFRFVGRMCSHALAAYNEMQSQYLRANPDHFRRRASVVSDFKDWAEDNGAGSDVSAVADYIAANPDLDGSDVGDLFDHVNDEPTRRDVRDFKDPYGGLPDMLYSGPGRLTPNLIQPAEDDDDGHRHEFVDVTEDDRKTTGPDQIVHFSRFLYADDAPGGFDWGTYSQGMGAPVGDGGTSSDSFIGGSGGGSAGGSSTPADPTGGLLGAPYGGGDSATPTDGFIGDAGGSNSLSQGTVDGLNNREYGSQAEADSFVGPGAGGGGAPSTQDFIGGGADTVPSAAGAPAPGAGANDIGAGDYEIQSGDTLSDIAERSGYGGDYQSLADANNIADPDVINAGDTINIPGQGGGGGTDAPDLGADVSTGQGTGTAPGPADTGVGGDGGALDGVSGQVMMDNGTGLTKAPGEVGYDVSGSPDASQTGSPADVGFDVPAPEPVSGDNPPADFSSPANTNPALNNPGTSGPSWADTFTDNKTGARFLYADDLSSDPAEPGVAGNEDTATATPLADERSNDPSAGAAAPGSQGGGGMGFDPSMIMDVAGPVISGISGLAGPVMDGIGGALSGILGNVKTADLLEKLRDLSDEDPDYGHMDEHNDEVAYVVKELRDRGYDVSQFVAGLIPGDHESFQGSGPDKKTWWESSQSYVENNERPNHVDVTDLDGDIIKYTTPQQKSSSFEDMSDDDFMDAVATRAASMVRTAGRHFSPAEQRELEDEYHVLGARNLPTDEDLAGTHYVS